MNSVGGFRDGEINGKPFHIFTSSSFSSGEAAIDSGGDNLLQPLFFCPSLRIRLEESKRMKNGYHSEDGFLPFDTSPHFLRIRTNVENYCKLPVAPLFWCNNKEPNDDGFSCGACFSTELGAYYYFCVTCHGKFHKECVECPLEIKHPSYPFLSLQLSYPPNSLMDLKICCGKQIFKMTYHSPTYNLSMHPFCAMQPIPIVIDNPKRHPHSLTFFPKQAFLPCNVCGEIKEIIPTYVCVRCVFVVHQDCIYFPYVIRISRHHHRISFTPSLPSGKFGSCGVCRRKMDNDYGAYSCNKCDDYFVHSRCALRKDLWDGEELEGVPEEPEIDVEPFARIADGIILHFSHGHHLKLEISRYYDEHKFFQACVLPIYKDNYYACMDQCDFFIHEACANAPLKKHQVLHAHPLTLKVVINGYDNNGGMFYCAACQRPSCGFVYEDSIGGQEGFKLDLQCALVYEPFEYQGHEHPLFLALNPEEEKSAICQICQEIEGKKLNCIECSYIICFRCATLPYKARYKHEKHFLTFYEGRDASDHSEWCDVCERKIVGLTKEGFYSCDDCCTSLHINYLLGADPYMKPGHTIQPYTDKDIHILKNNTLSRPFCHVCKQRCPHKVVFKCKNIVCCSLPCAEFLCISYGL